MDRFHQLSSKQTKALKNWLLFQSHKIQFSTRSVSDRQDKTLIRPESEKKFHPPAAQELWVDSKKGHEKGKHSPSIGLAPLFMKKPKRRYNANNQKKKTDKRCYQELLMHE